MSQQGVDVNDPFQAHKKPSVFQSGWRQPRQGGSYNGESHAGSYKQKAANEDPKLAALRMMGLGVAIYLISAASYMICWELYKPFPVFLSLFMLVVSTKLMGKTQQEAATVARTDYLLPSLAGNNGMLAMRVWFRIVTCWLAVLLGAVCGMHAEEKYMSHFYAMTFGREYTSVAANTRGAAYTDAGSVTFGSSSNVDIVQSVGFKSGHNYCVAPVLDTNQGRKSVAFWAIGYDCCDARGNFDCGDGTTTSRKGARAPPDGVFYKDTGMFMKAVEQASAVYDLDIDDHVILLHWVKDHENRKIGKLFAAGGAILLGTALFALGAFVLNVLAFSPIGFFA